MTEAIRFYWRGRDESIPLGEIPEQDRTPLRIRRSVVQKYTPSVVKQLEEGRFVAAAWEAGGQIHLLPRQQRRSYTNPTRQRGIRCVSLAGASG